MPASSCHGGEIARALRIERIDHLREREGLRLLEDRQERRQAELDRARALIQVGADQLERGQVVDGDAFFREWDDELDALEAAQRRKTE